MVKKIPLDDQTQTILSYMTFSNGPDGSVIGKISAQLERKTYEKVNKALVAMGGKWNRKVGGHIFATDPRPHVETAIDEGSLTVEKDGFFETPPEVVDRMLAMCGDLAGLNILEPSAGAGAIAARIPDSATLFCIEKNPDRCAVLRKKGYDVHNSNFLESGPFVSGFDRIIMNPPFEAGQDMDHVQHAYSMLAPGGILVSIMSEGPFFRSDRKAATFRDWLDDVGGYSIELPDKSFHASGTDVRTRLVTIRAPRATLTTKGDTTMKTIIQAQELGTFSLEDAGKLTLRQALKENDLIPKEWRLIDTHETKTTITYTVAPRIPRAVVAYAPISQETGIRFFSCPSAIVSAPPVSAPASDFNLDPRTSLLEPASAPVVSAFLSVPRKDFEDALKVAVDFAAPRTTLPILTNVRLTSDGTTLTIYATDLECYWTRTIPLAEGAPISTAVYASILYSEVKALDADVARVQLTIDNEARTISVNGRCSIHTSDPEEFPEAPIVTGQEISITDLPAKLKKVEPAISTDQTRYVLTGAQIDFAGGKILATDGFRLHLVDITALPVATAVDSVSSTSDSNLAPVSSIILPHRAVTLMIKHGTTPTITIDGTEARKYISYPLHGGVMVSRLLEGLYPDWQKVLPEKLPISVEFDSKEFFKVVEGVIPIAGAKSTISLTVNGALSIETEGDCGRYHWQIPCTVIGKGDESYRVLYNLKFITDALKSYAGDGPAIIEFSTTYGATRINENAIVMPIRA